MLSQGVGAAVAGDWVEGSLSFNLDLFASIRRGEGDELAAAAAAAAAAAIERAEAAERRNKILEEEVRFHFACHTSHVTRHTSHVAGNDSLTTS
jgi:hypothetical protein